MIKSIWTVLLVSIFFSSIGQDLHKRNYIWPIPTLNTKINGVAVGLFINSLKGVEDRILTTQVNGVCLEIIGLGLFLPLTGSDPIYTDPDSVYKNKILVDSIAKTYHLSKYKINGLAISAGGIGGHNILVNGFNLSGLNTFTSKLNGISTAIMFNMTGVVNGISIAGLGNETLVTNGVQIGIFNQTSSLKGLQIGLFNHTKHLKGFQLGLWNNNGKRKLPFINWNFK